MVTALARIDGRPVGVIANQPRRLGGVIDAAAAEKAALLRRLLRPLRPAAGRPRRHPGLHARAAPGARRGDPPRRLAAARVRGGPGAEADRGPAQGLRRRRDHDELARTSAPTSSSPGPGRDRDHGRAPGRRDRPPARGSRRPTTPRATLGRARATPTPRSTSSAERGRRRGLRRRGDRAARDAGAPRLGARRAGAPMTRRPVRRDRRASRSAARRSRASSRSTSRSATASPRAPAAAPGEAWPERLAAGAARAQPAARAAQPRGRGRDQRRGARAAPARRSSSSPTWSRSSAAPTTCCARPVRTPSAYARPARRRSSAALRRANPGVRIVTATSPERWDFLELGPAHARRGSSAGSPRSTAPPGRSPTRYGVPCLEVAGHPGLCRARELLRRRPAPLAARPRARRARVRRAARERFGIAITIEGGRRMNDDRRLRSATSWTTGGADDHRGRPGLVRRR